MVKPKGHNPQTQPITVALSNICRDYPAGGGILRELLQNADDAGASTVRFVLDPTHYPTRTLVDEGVQDLQGPALLAYNDAIFSEQDFASISRIGDSGKKHDGSTTGKFGRGFNAVYHWTDSPSIVSRDCLLILEPHQEWSRKFKNPGGPHYDFVAQAEVGDMTDQMTAFSTVMEEFDQPFQGTIIRIPLRTPEQAKKSKICDRAASFSDIAEVMRNFVNDFGYTGLLFMKHVSKIAVDIGNEEPIVICIKNGEKVREHKAKINDAIKKTLSEEISSFSLSFEIDITSGTFTTKRDYHFAVHHMMQKSPEIESLGEWSKREAMVPWVAIASELRKVDGEITGGSLFNVLPSPIRINQPVQIHGYFSMSPDRANLHGLGDSSVQYPLPGKWNLWLFEELIPTAWANLLDFLAKQYPNQSAFNVWPKAQEDVNNTFHHVDEKVLQIVEKKGYGVWYTDLGYMTLDSGLVARIEKSPRKRKALAEAGVPVIYLPENLMSRVETTCKVNHLTPQSTCRFLERNQERLRNVSEDAKQVLLDFVLSDPAFRGYGAVELFPFEDGAYRAIANQAAFIHRDEEERVLFNLDTRHSISLQKISAESRLILERGCSTLSLHPSLRNRSTRDLREYCLSTHFKTFKAGKDCIFVNNILSDFISKVWCWIEARQCKKLDENLCCLWLLPLSDGGYRKIKPSNISFDTIYAKPGKLGDFLISLAAIKHGSNCPTVKGDKLTETAKNLLTGALKGDPTLYIKTSDSIEDFMCWLQKIRHVLNSAPTSYKVHLLGLLAAHKYLCQDRKTISTILKSLRIFKSVAWKPENGHMVLQETWVTLEELPSGDKIGLHQLTPTPNIGSVTFLDAQSDDTKSVLEYFELAEFPSPLELVKRFLIPFWQESRLLRNWTKSGKEKICESLLRNYFNLDSDYKARVSSMPIIPVKRLNGKMSDKFCKAEELIDSSAESLRGLFFADEEVFPMDSLLRDYRAILMTWGLRTELDKNVVMDRVKRFAERSRDAKEISERAQRLLQSQSSWKSDLNGDEIGILRSLQWLPATDLQSLQIFKNAQQCRGLDSKLLVGFVIPTLRFEISPEWSLLLGWNSVIPQNILLEQLKKGIEQNDHTIINAVLEYIQQKDLLENLRSDLLNLSCVVASNLQLVPVQQVFQTGCDRLQPYAYNVEKRFWTKHKLLLKALGIPKTPALEVLLKLQEDLPSENELEENQISIAIEIVKLASAFPRKQLSLLKILDGTGILRTIEEVTYNDIELSTITGSFHFAHPDIPRSVVEELRIEPLSARVKRCRLGITDADEFDQHEDVATAISDTLTRYTVESTFREFLANAEDCGSAKELNWLLDDRFHSNKYILTDELREFQGQALLVHNDGVFSEADFEGLKHVGRGSKRDDASTIGKFGRGSQTMYHWTDVPMILSAKWLVILETDRRPPGIKIELSRLKDLYRDQLTPFEGLWGFSRDLDYYQGTIFRFPLRARSSESKLLEIGTPLDFKAALTCVNNFLVEEGRVSLLFLTRIRYMDFHVYGDKEPLWSIRRLTEDKSSSGWTNCTITERTNGELNSTFTDRWRVSIKALENVASDLQYRHKRTMKTPSCGIAALVPDSLCKQKPFFKNALVPKYFSSLPLSFQTDLPVHIHATFILASDRASIPVEDSMQEDGAKWNKWLLSNAIPRLYLDFLADIGREILSLEEPFQFWPQKAPAERALSEPVYTAFWQKLQNSPHPLFPLKRQISQAKLGECIHPELVKITDAVFEFLSEPQSTDLADILESQIPNLVKPPQTMMAKLQEIKVQTVTPERILKLFKNGASKYLEDAVSKNSKVLEQLFDLIEPVLGQEIEKLNGCKILPLANGNFGTLKLSTPSNRHNHYFLANSEELKLFDFASDVLVSEEDPGELFKEAVLDSEKFNVTRLDLSDMGTILKKRNFEAVSVSKEMNNWLVKFWEYYRPVAGENNLVKPLASFWEISEYPVFLAGCNGIKSYIAPAKWADLPSVIEPNNKQHLSLCEKFPGLYIFNSRFMPAHLIDTENSLEECASFDRFITALVRLANLAGMKLTVYVDSHLNFDEKKVLCNLLIIYDSTRDPGKFFTMRDHLMALPVWPNADSSACISAAGAHGNKDPRFLVPWMRDYKLFIDPAVFTHHITTLKEMGVPETPGTAILSEYVLPRFPEKVPSFDSYRSLIKGIIQLQNWQGCVPQLRRTRLALNRAQKLHIPSELFDHEDLIFRAAFRNDEQHVFIHERLESFRGFWLQIGLKHRIGEQFSPEDYITCLTKMKNRLSSCKDETLRPGILADAQTVLEPLTTPSNALCRLNSLEWNIVSDEACFPVKTDFGDQFTHRRAQMEILAAGIPLLRLSEIFEVQYMSVCWSQTSFPVAQPTVTTLDHLKTKGKPPAIMVWQHLQYMSSSVESLAEDSVESFLFDLYDTYDYLQDNRSESRESFSECQGAQVWFNLELTDLSLIRKADLILSRCAIENLILESCCEAKNLKSVKQGLFQWQKLLRELNCKSIVYPSFNSREIRDTPLISTSLDLLRKNGAMLDLTLKSKGGLIRAHKVVMAASSQYFQAKYKSQWLDNDIIDLELFSYSTLSAVVDFAYTDAFDWTTMRLGENETEANIADKLDDLLDLLEAAEYFGMPNLKSQAEVQILTPAKTIIKESNVLGVRDRASEAKAVDLENYCNEFYEKNKEAVELANKE